MELAALARLHGACCARTVLSFCLVSPPLKGDGRGGTLVPVMQGDWQTFEDPP